MKYQKILFPLLFFIILLGHSQSSVGEIGGTRLKSIKKKQFEEIKSSDELLFVRPKQFSVDYDSSEYEKMLQESWKICPFRVIDDNEIYKYANVGKILVRFKSRTMYTKSGGSYSFVYFKFSKINKLTRKKDSSITWKDKSFGIIRFTSDIEARVDMMNMKDSIGGDLIDYRLGYLKNYFQQINNSLLASESYAYYDDLTDNKELINLKKSTLYIPKNVLYKFNALTAKKKDQDPTLLFRDYPYSYAEIDDYQLNNKILNDKESFYYLLYHQLNARKVITVVNGLTGDIVYRASKNMSYNLKPKDINNIVKTIQKL